MKIVEFPKVELHLHLEGAAPTKFVKEIAAEKNTQIDQLFDSCGNYKFSNFSEFLAIYQTVSDIFNSPQDFNRLTTAVLEECALNNVIYAEVFLAPEFCGNNDIVAWLEYVAAIKEAADLAEQKYGIVLRCIPTCIRHLGFERAKLAAECAAESAGDFITGFGMAGDETAGRQKDFLYSFELASEAGLALTSHAGEWRGPMEVFEAIQNLNVARIGHGVSAIMDNTVIDLIVKKNITLEVCPGSNVALGIFKNMAKHPIEKLRKSGVNVTVSTDDPPFFNTSMNEEYISLSDSFNWHLKDFADLNQTSINAAFCDDMTKTKIKRTLDNYYLTKMS